MTDEERLWIAEYHRLALAADWDGLIAHIRASVNMSKAVLLSANPQVQAAVCNVLDSIPEGCTPADAKMLREANHGLAESVSDAISERDEWKRNFEVANTREHEAIAADRAVERALGRADGADALIAYLDGLFVSGNGIPVDRPWFSAETWGVVKDFVRNGLPLDHDRVEIERIYRQKTAAGLRAYSPMKAALEARAEVPK